MSQEYIPPLTRLYLTKVLKYYTSLLNKTIRERLLLCFIKNTLKAFDNFKNMQKSGRSNIFCMFKGTLMLI